MTFFSIIFPYPNCNLLSFADHCCSVKIQKITVPSVVVIDYNRNLSENSKRSNQTAHQFILDCEYDVDKDEHGLVIKWFLNNVLVYQWIPPRLPTSMATFKNRTKKNFAFSDDPNKRHRGVVVIKPTLNFSGEYQCSVQTFQSSDKKSSHLQIVGEYWAFGKDSFNDNFKLRESWWISPE